MKLTTITKEKRDKIIELRGKLAAVLGEETTATDELTRLNERQEKLQEEISKLEKANSESEESATKLATKRVQLEQVCKKVSVLTKSTPATVAGRELEISGLLRQAARALASATGPDVEKYALAIAAKLRPFCSDAATARSLAYQTPAAKNLLIITTRAWGSFGVNVAELKAVIDYSDQIISGEISWEWNSKE
jgi:hypothetical protein